MPCQQPQPPEAGGSWTCEAMGMGQFKNPMLAEAAVESLHRAAFTRNAMWAIRARSPSRRFEAVLTRSGGSAAGGGGATRSGVRKALGFLAQRAEAAGSGAMNIRPTAWAGCPASETESTPAF